MRPQPAAAGRRSPPESAPAGAGALSLPTGRGDEVIPLTVLEFKLLTTLARKPWQAFTREHLLEEVWEYRHAADTRLVNVHVQRLRAKVEKDADVEERNRQAKKAKEFEEALEHFRQAIDLDETYFEAMIHAAEVLIHPMGAFDDAIRMCDDALDYAETDDETDVGTEDEFDTRPDPTHPDERLTEKENDTPVILLYDPKRHENQTQDDKNDGNEGVHC